MNLEKEHQAFIESLLSGSEVRVKNSPKEPNGKLDVSVVRVQEGQLVELRDGIVVDAEIIVEMLDKLAAFEGEFGPIDEVRDKLVQVRKIEENLGPLDELESLVESLEEKASKLLESLEEGGHGLYGEHEYEYGEEEDKGGVEDEETGNDEEEEEEVDVSELTVREFLAMMLRYLADEDEEEEDEVDVDFEDLDLENIADMKIADVLNALREGKGDVKRESSNCGCKDKKKMNEESQAADPMFMSEIEVMGMVYPDKKKNDEKGKHHKHDHEQDQEHEYKHEHDHQAGADRGEEDKKESFEEPFELEIFKRLLDRLG